MKFADSHPEFESIRNGTVYNIITDRLFDELKKFILNYADTTRRLTVVCVDLEGRLSQEPIRATLDWNLRQAYFENLFLQLRQKSFTGMMDFLSDFAELYFDANARSRLNLLLERNNFKYVLTLDQQNESIWKTAESLESIAQTAREIKQSLYPEEILNSIERSASRMRGVLSGQDMRQELKNIFQTLEKEIMFYTGEFSVKEAFTLMHNDTRWGTPEIIKEDQLSYDYLQTTLTAQPFPLDNSDVMYWIERLELFRRHLAIKNDHMIDN